MYKQLSPAVISLASGFRDSWRVQVTHNAQAVSEKDVHLPDRSPRAQPPWGEGQGQRQSQEGLPRALSLLASHLRSAARQHVAQKSGQSSGCCNHPLLGTGQASSIHHVAATLAMPQQLWRCNKHSPAHQVQGKEPELPGPVCLGLGWCQSINAGMQLAQEPSGSSLQSTASPAARPLAAFTWLWSGSCRI